MSTEWIGNLLEKIKEHIEHRKYRVTEHALNRQSLRSLKLPDIIEILRNGFHEKDIPLVIQESVMAMSDSHCI